MTVVVKFTRPSTSTPWYSESSAEAAAQAKAFVIERAGRPGFVSQTLVEKTTDGLSETYAVKWATTADRLAYKPQFFTDRAAYNLLHGIVFETTYIDDAAVALAESVAKKEVATQVAATLAATAAAAAASAPPAPTATIPVPTPTDTPVPTATPAPTASPAV